jgi:phenylalanyl-tRNA synthetase alpha chain
MIGELQQLEKNALAELAMAATEEQILAVRTKYLGRKGLLTGLLRNITLVPDAEKPLFGKRCNEVKNILNTNTDNALQLQANRKKENILLREKIDVTLPGRVVHCGRIHPVIQVRREICAIFISFGFSIVEGPEIELDYYNFEALNIPKDHPARDMQDTFYVE